MSELLPYAPGSPEWLAARRQGVTATDIVTILGLSSHDSPYSLYWRKLGQVPEVPDNDRFRLGRELEPYVRQRWLQEHDADCTGGFGFQALFHNSDRPWQLATLDMFGWDADTGRPTLVVELKTWADADKPAWHNGPPPVVRVQVLWQMDVMGVATGHVGVVFLPSGEFRSYVIEHNGNCHDTDLLELTDSKPLCPVCDDQEIMRMEGEKFMQRLRLELPAPDPDASAATLAAVKARFARQPDKQAEINPDLWVKFEASCLMLDAHKQVKQEYEIQLREQAGEASVYTVSGQPVARRIVVDAEVRAHTRHQDYLKRIKTEANGDE